MRRLLLALVLSLLVVPCARAQWVPGNKESQWDLFREWTSSGGYIVQGDPITKYGEFWANCHDYILPFFHTEEEATTAGQFVAFTQREEIIHTLRMILLCVMVIAVVVTMALGFKLWDFLSLGSPLTTERHDGA